MTTYTYNGVAVRIFHDSDVATDMRTHGRYHELVQQVIDEVEPWEGSKGHRKTIRFQGLDIQPDVIRVQPGTQLLWGVHIAHRANNPGLSPFTHLSAHPSEVGYITVQLAGPSDRPYLARAHGGVYVSPLPWMARKANVEQSCRYWRTHAYRCKPGDSGEPSNMQPNTLTMEPPDWFIVP